jgi:hypothetical protein
MDAYVPRIIWPKISGSCASSARGNINHRQIASGAVAVFDGIACFVGDLRKPVSGIVNIFVGERGDQSIWVCAPIPMTRSTGLLTYGEKAFSGSGTKRP